MTWIRVASVAEVDAEGGLIGRVVGGMALALFAVEGAYYATEDMCSHGQARLSQGWLDGHLIECPLHQGLFDIRTGEAKGPPCTKPIRVFETRVDGGALFVRLESGA